jgi:hypothetical protein
LPEKGKLSEWAWSSGTWNPQLETPTLFEVDLSEPLYLKINMLGSLSSWRKSCGNTLVNKYCMTVGGEEISSEALRNSVRDEALRTFSALTFNASSTELQLAAKSYGEEALPTHLRRPLLGTVLPSCRPYRSTLSCGSFQPTTPFRFGDLFLDIKTYLVYSPNLSSFQ